ncbi:MAG: methyltransferase domain-containing protein [Nitrospinota bacterium]|nr:methyltransferase domain-containing protein [Nitrospinota bacterium]
MTSDNHGDHVNKQRDDWNAVADAWEKYDGWLSDNFASFDKTLIERAGIGPGHKALDLGSGTGNPALAAARTVGPHGSVVGVDVAEKMLDVARRRAQAMGIDNVEFQVCHAGAISFEKESFDAATSRFCLMFLPDVSAALRGVHSALKPGARFTAAVWGTPEKNLSFTIAMKVLHNFGEAAAPDPSAPSPFSLGAPGKLKGFMEEAGFVDTTEEAVPVQMSFPSLEFYISNMKEMAAPVRAILEKLDGQSRASAMNAIVEEVRKFETPEGAIRFHSEAMIVSGMKAPA